ncbi:MAG: AbgT family transporter [Gammaproteobacteria bacterium]|nr:AbgT family transporter [Gammaproteobacteria bacterium]
MSDMLQKSWLTKIERLGNRLPDPAYLFIIGTVFILVCAEAAVWFNLQIEKPSAGGSSQLLQARSVISAEGVWWWLSTLVKNFIEFPPLGIVLVGMLGIGLAERCGLLPALIVMAGNAVREKYLVPAIIFIGIMSSMALDAGYVVLPPIAAILFMAAGRSPVLGIVASFAGVSAGFGANLFVTSIDPLLAGFTETSAQFLDANYKVAVTSNWWFMIASTIVLTFTGWLVTTKWVAPRVANIPYQNPSAIQDSTIVCDSNKSALIWSGSAFVLLILLILLAVKIPGAPLYGNGNRFPRWVEVTVPLLFFVFVIPGIVFGLKAKTIQNSKQFAKYMGDTIADLGPYIVLAFFAAQFIAVFKYTHLGEMLALAGGGWLASLHLDVGVLLFAFVLLACLANLLIGSMSAKYAFMAPVFVPMLMQVGIAPELTQVAYRIGDSVTNVITPLNPYMIIVLAMLQKYHRDAGIGTLISLTLPYSIGFFIAWVVLLITWVVFKIPLGPGFVY